MRTLVLGGAASGESDYAERLLSGPSTVIAVGDGAATALRDAPGPVLLTDLDVWAATGPGEDAVAQLCAAIAEHDADVVVVSREVGLSLVAKNQQARQEHIGRVNTAVADAVDRAVLIVAGRVLPLDGSPLGAMRESTRRRSIAHSASVDRPLGDDDRPLGENLRPVGEGVGFAEITAPDTDAADAARRLQEHSVGPRASLGRLEEIGIWASACQGTCPPRPITAPTVVLFTDAPTVPPTTAVLAERTGASVRIENVATTGDAGDALAAGRAAADHLVDAGADLLVAGGVGTGDDVAAAVIVGTLTAKEPVEVVGTGPTMDAADWIALTAAVRDGMWRTRGLSADPLALVDAAGSPTLAAIAGFLAQAALRRTPVIVDDLPVTAAALLADTLAPGAAEWWVAGQVSAHPAHPIALQRLGLTPLLDLGINRGGATGALAALPVVAAAIEVLAVTPD
ncbi:bifunctional adenosylcobinamide kinase/adenosylcobinamide-phosphate guanylyltransferase [Gordonia sp. (in: high G+C Gram-positive bacteria)]|uniref:bifunctional adenosylcobinamide kinase/adenosylcobinamide-phosphate guanylyltransferase n=1 Tax=Gordonia sp. (in: high G+C Gram-positive bacteria) TaxID=84139 RepID=UPI0039E5AAD2